MDQRDSNYGQYMPPPQYQPYQPPQKPKKKGKVGPILLGAVVGVFVLIVIGAVASSGNSGSGNAAAASQTTAASNPHNAAPAQPAAPATTVAAPAAPTQKVLFTKSGNGLSDTRQFTVSDNWALQYSFDCSSAGGQGNFIVYEDYPSGNILANALSAKGSDTSYQTGDAGTHTLKISSECDWTIKVIDNDAGQ